MCYNNKQSKSSRKGINQIMIWQEINFSKLMLKLGEIFLVSIQGAAATVLPIKDQQ